MSDVKRFKAPGPWITRELRDCVQASDYDALAAKLAAAERDAARYRHLRSLRGLTVTFRDHVRFKTSSGNKLIEVRTIGEYDLDAALDAMAPRSDVEREQS